MAAIVFIIVCALLEIFVEAVLSDVQHNIIAIPNMAFNVQSIIDKALDYELTQSLNNVFVGTAISLITVLLLKKGFETYVAYTDGDPDSDPVQLLTLYCKGIAVITGGQFVVDVFINIVKDLTDNIQSVFSEVLSLDSIVDDGLWTVFINGLIPDDPEKIGSHLLMIFLSLIYGIIVWILYFILLKDGLELWIIKVGLPLASIGLINSDKGIFKNYVMSISKALVTIMVKVSLMHLGFLLVVGFHEVDDVNLSTAWLGLVLGIMCNIMAFAIPRLLQEFMIAGGGGNTMMKMYYTKSMISSLFRRK